jgi:hypothetical protein
VGIRGWEQTKKKKRKKKAAKLTEKRVNAFSEGVISDIFIYIQKSKWVKTHTDENVEASKQKNECNICRNHNLAFARTHRARAK